MVSLLGAERGAGGGMGVTLGPPCLWTKVLGCFETIGDRKLIRGFAAGEAFAGFLKKLVICVWRDGIDCASAFRFVLS